MIEKGKILILISMFVHQLSAQINDRDIPSLYHFNSSTSMSYDNRQIPKMSLVDKSSSSQIKKPNKFASFLLHSGNGLYFGLVSSVFAATSTMFIVNDFGTGSGEHIFGFVLGSPIGYTIGVPLGTYFYRKRKGLKPYGLQSFGISLLASGLAASYVLAMALQSGPESLSYTIPIFAISIPMANALYLFNK
jgi:hypothetical protein